MIDLLDSVAAEPSDLLAVFEHALDQLGDDLSYEFVTPRSAARLIAEMVGPITAGSRCFDPFCRTGELLVEVNRVAGEGGAVPVVVRGSHPEPAFVELAEMNLSMHGASALVSRSEPASPAMPVSDRFDVVVSNPPFGSLAEADVMHRRYGPSRRREFNWLQIVVESLDENGRGGVIMPNGAAFTLSHRDREIRRALVEDGALTAVVALPTQLFRGTSIGVTLWLVQRPSGQSGEMLFIDAQKLGVMSTRTRRQLTPQDIEEVSQEYRRWRLALRTDGTFVPRAGFSATATAAAIAKQNYSLFPPSYVEPGPIAPDRDSEADFWTLAKELVRLTDAAQEADADVRKMLRGFSEG
ncbi:class I SAM-dependent DNA methyltransferase [Micromonospora sp. NPDC005252]|uniref:HsdM family class I SAM-dependent methyltransferase n=1 Tax=unclassified Micromonospora TaxID=2617518 RepID=UPI003682F1BE